MNWCSTKYNQRNHYPFLYILSFAVSSSSYHNDSGLTCGARGHLDPQNYQTRQPSVLKTCSLETNFYNQSAEIIITDFAR